jgi:hypothetical protein
MPPRLSKLWLPLPTPNSNRYDQTPLLSWIQWSSMSRGWINNKETRLLSWQHGSEMSDNHSGASPNDSRIRLLSRTNRSKVMAMTIGNRFCYSDSWREKCWFPLHLESTNYFLPTDIYPFLYVHFVHLHQILRCPNPSTPGPVTPTKANIICYPGAIDPR